MSPKNVLTPSTPPDGDLSTVLTAYQVAAKLMMYEGRLGWQITVLFISFATALVAGSIFPAFIGSKSVRSIAIVGLILSVIGFFSTLAWWSMLMRSRRYYSYWIACAKELEERLGGSVDILRRGEKFAGGDTVSVLGKKLRFRTIERITMKTTLIAVYLTYALIFAFLVVFNFCRIVEAF